MQIVIEISEEDYKKSNEIYRGLPKNVRDKEVILKAIANGTPLKTGHWKPYLKEGLTDICSECGSRFDRPWNYCPNCGCRMVEPQESEDKE